MRADNDLERAKRLLRSGDYTLALVRGDESIVMSERGIKPLVKLVDSGADLSGFCAADRIVGKAAACLYTLLCVRSLYAEVCSAKGAAWLRKASLPFSYGLMSARIENRAKTGACPMDIAVDDADSASDALERIRRTLATLPNMS